MSTNVIQPKNGRANGNGASPEAPMNDNTSGRQRRGAMWLVIFQAATLIGVIILSILLITLINDTFGLVAIENEIDPEALALAAKKAELIAAPNTVSSEDDEDLAAGVASSPYAVGYFGYAYLQNHADTLKSIGVEGVPPSRESVNDGSYPLARPLFLYSASQLLKERPDVAEFIDYYLSHVNEEIDDVGYFPVAQEHLDAGKQLLSEAGATPGVQTEDGVINVVGSSTVYPLTLRLAERFKEDGYTGEIAIENIGTDAGFSRFCSEKSGDLVNASRQMGRAMRNMCQKSGRAAAEFRVGVDALSVIVSQENAFLSNASQEELQKIFEVEKWSDVRSEWPNEPILRFVPGVDSGTADFFIDRVYDPQLEDLSADQLIAILQAGVSPNRFRALEAQKPMSERTHEEIYELVNLEVVQPTIVASWTLFESIFQRNEIEAFVAEKYPTAELEWYAWLNREFLTSPQSSNPQYAGVRTAILGSLWVVLIAMLVAIPMGIGAGVYLEEYAGDSRINRIIQTNIDNLSGVPSIIYGMLGLTIFVRWLGYYTSGAAFGMADPNVSDGRTILSAGLTLALLILPVLIINTQEAIRAVPKSLREAGYGLGASKWQVTRTHVLSNALPGIMTGAILAMSRAMGETAPLILVGASTYITVDPTSVFSKFTVLPMQIYQWTTRPQLEFQHIAAAASIVLLILLVMLNATAIYLRNRYSKQL